MTQVTKLILGYAILTLFFPGIFYKGAYLLVVAIYLILGTPVSSGIVSISYFGLMPIVGFFLYLSQRNDSVDTSYKIFVRAPLVEYLGLSLLLIWYGWMVVNIYTTYRGGVAIPNMQTPITSLALWFCGILFGYGVAMVSIVTLKKLKEMV